MPYSQACSAVLLVSRVVLILCQLRDLHVLIVIASSSPPLCASSPLLSVPSTLPQALGTTTYVYSELHFFITPCPLAPGTPQECSSCPQQATYRTPLETCDVQEAAQPHKAPLFCSTQGCRVSIRTKGPSADPCQILHRFVNTPPLHAHALLQAKLTRVKTLNPHPCRGRARRWGGGPGRQHGGLRLI